MFIYEYFNPKTQEHFYYSSVDDLSDAIGDKAVIGSDLSYYTAIPEIPSHPIDEQKTNAINNINRAAGMSRAKYITVEPGQESTYQLKLSEAKAYAIAKANNTIDPNDYPVTNTEAAACGSTLDDVINLVNTVAEQWIQLAAIIEGQRRGSIVKIQNAKTKEDIDAIQPIWP